MPRASTVSMPDAAAPLVLYCLPYAGGNAWSYRPLAGSAPPGLVVRGVDLPGHGRRAREPLCTSLEALADDVYAQLRAGIVDRRYALFGHSMGATLAYLCALRIRRDALPLPQALFLSGAAAPDAREACDLRRHLLPSREFLAMLTALGGVPPEIVQHQELVDYFEPLLRADFAAIENWRPLASPPLPVLFVVLRGRDDTVSAEQAAAWSYASSAGCAVYEFDGDHFFVNSQCSAIAARIEATLTACLA